MLYRVRGASHPVTTHRTDVRFVHYFWGDHQDLENDLAPHSRSSVRFARATSNRGNQEWTGSLGHTWSSFEENSP